MVNFPFNMFGSHLFPYFRSPTERAKRAHGNWGSASPTPHPDAPPARCDGGPPLPHGAYVAETSSHGSAASSSVQFAPSSASTAAPHWVTPTGPIHSRAGSASASTTPSTCSTGQLHRGTAWKPPISGEHQGYYWSIIHKNVIILNSWNK